MKPADLRATVPKNIAYTKTKLKIEWMDGHHSEWELLPLRKNCPCAVCRGGDFGPIGAMTGNITEASIASYKKMGRYAISIRWMDNHDTGIYTYDSLRAGCECPDCTATRSKEK